MTADEMEHRACMIHLTHSSGAWASILAQCKYPCAVQASLRSTPTAHWAARSAAPALPGRSWCPLHHCHSWWMVSGSWPCSRQWRQGGSRHVRYQHRGRQPGGQASVLCPTRLWHSSNITSTSPSRDSASHSTICHSLLQQAYTRRVCRVERMGPGRQQAAGSREGQGGSSHVCRALLPRPLPPPPPPTE